MNKSIFELNKVKIKHYIFITLIIVGVFSLLYTSKSSFVATYKNQEKYTADAYYKEVDTILYMYIDSVNKTLETKIAIRDIKTIYSKLKFYIPEYTDNFVSKDEIRLVGYTPKTAEEKIFFYNSNFKKMLELQGKPENLTTQFFTIKFNDSCYIESIKINRTSNNMVLSPNNWKGTISLLDSYRRGKDSSVIYYINNNNKTKALMRNVVSPNNIRDLKTQDSSVVIHYFKNNNGRNNSSVIKFANNIFENQHKFRLYSENVKSIIYGNGKERTEKDSIIVPVDKSLRIKITSNCTLNRQIKPKTIYVTKSSPYEKISKPMNSINGYGRVRLNDLEMDLATLQIINKIETTLSHKDKTAKIALSINPELSKSLEVSFEKYITELEKDFYASIKKLPFNNDKSDYFEISMTLMDIRTGEIIAVPFYKNSIKKDKINDTIDVKNPNLIRHRIGSTFKPLMSFAAAYKYPKLKDFVLKANNIQIDTTKVNFLGYKLNKYGYEKGEPDDHFWSNETINRAQFLAKSHNNYPIALALYAMTEEGTDSPQEVTLYNKLANETLENSFLNNLGSNVTTTSRFKYYENNVDFMFLATGSNSYLKLLHNLYDINIENNNDSNNYETKLWGNVLFTGKSKDEDNMKYAVLFPDKSTFYLDYFGNHSNKDEYSKDQIDSDNFRLFEHFVLGDRDNRWTNIKLAEAYSRLISKRETNATFIEDQRNDTLLYRANKDLFYPINHTDINKKDVHTIWYDFINDWTASNDIDRTYETTLNCFKNINNENGNIYKFYGKTGTPDKSPISTEMKDINNNKKKKKHLEQDEGLFVFGITNDYNNASAMPTGIVGVIHINHITRYKERNFIKSKHAANFLTEEIYRKIINSNLFRFVIEPESSIIPR